MNEAAYAKLLKELDAVGELVRTRQDEKQTVMDDFDKERARYRHGRISEDTVSSSASKTNKELMRLDKQIREAIQRAGRICGNVRDLTSRQAPRAFRAHVSGMRLASSGSSKKSRSKPKRKASKKSGGKIVVTKTMKKKELALDKKFSKKKR